MFQYCTFLIPITLKSFLILNINFISLAFFIYIKCCPIFYFFFWNYIHISLLVVNFIIVSFLQIFVRLLCKNKIQVFLYFMVGRSVVCTNFCFFNSWYLYLIFLILSIKEYNCIIII